MAISYKSILRVAVIVGVLLLIPLALTIRDGGVEGVGWNWTGFDFLVMGTLLFITGMAIEAALAKFKKPFHRAVAVVVILFACLAIWAELAVGAIEQLFAFLLVK